MLERVWIVQDEFDGSFAVTVCANRDAAVKVALGIIKDWHGGGERMAREFLELARRCGERDFCYAYDGDAYIVDIKAHEVIG